MKYEFKKNGQDDYSLTYKDKTINFKSSVNVVNKLQEAEANAKIKMIADLSSKGISLRSLTIEIEKDGKKYYDNTNRTQMEQAYVQKEFTEIFSNIIIELLGMSLQELYTDMELNQEELQKFSEEFGLIITGQYKFPSREVLSKENN